MPIGDETVPQMAAGFQEMISIRQYENINNNNFKADEETKKSNNVASATAAEGISNELKKVQ